MGAYAVPSKQPFITSKPLKTKRKRGRIEEIMKLMDGAHFEIDAETGEHRLMRGDEVIGVFKEDNGDECHE